MKARCDRDNYMILRWRYVDIEHRLSEMDFSLYGIDVGDLVEGWYSSNTWGVSWIKQMVTDHRYGGT